ncbi:MAG TPA: tetratricopeptide repeat protein, partial [Anaerolineales bacterium]|nr:tetratricopeptide repeat protein [Anaerolineales bacterium]
DQNAAAVGQIARRLDGIPLALELAAVRSRGMTIEQIAARLDDRFRLLTGGSRTALPRQQTLRAAIDWSHNLLSQEERSLFRQLPVFAGSWTLEAAEGVTPAGELGAAQVADTLLGLVEKSMVILDVSSGRYRMLETIREYALERLRDSGEEAELRGRHLNYYLTLAEGLNFAENENRDALARLEREQDNLVAAIRWCQHAEGGGEQALRMLQAMGLYWNLVQQNRLGFQLAQQSLALPGAEARSPARCRALIALGMTGYFQARYAEAQHALEQALSLARENDDSRGIVMAQHWRANVLNAMGEHVAARSLLEDALGRAKELHFDIELARLQNNTAELLRGAGDLEAAQALYEQSLASTPSPSTNPFTVYRTLNLAMVTILQGDLGHGRDLVIKGLDLVEQGGHRFASGTLFTLLSFAGLLSALERWADAARIYGAFEAERRRGGDPLENADAQFAALFMDRARKELGEQAYQRAFDDGYNLSGDEALSEVRALLRSGE